jgi:hypothetical protein
LSDTSGWVVWEPPPADTVRTDSTAAPDSTGTVRVAVSGAREPGPRGIQVPLNVYAARVIRASDDRSANYLILDAGTEDGVAVGQGVIALGSAVGRVHASSAPALRLLQQEGLRCSGHVDLFDAGPMVDCPTAQLRTLVHGRRAVIGAWGDPAATQPALLSVGEREAFRCWADHVPADFRDSFLQRQPAHARLLSWGAGRARAALA